MPVRHFDEWAVARTQQLPLTALKDAAIGIDATHFLKKFTSGVFQEPLVAAIGGIPFMLRHTIQTDLRKLKEHGIKPIFVFDGLSLPPQQKPLETPDQNPVFRNEAWELYDKSMANQAVDAFRKSDSIPTRDIERFLMDILQDNGVDFQVAPYLAVAQLAYLENNAKGFIDAIWAPSEIFMFDVDKVISSINMENSTFQYVNKRAFQSELGAQSDQIVDALILTGSDLIPTFAPFANASSVTIFKSIIDALQRHTSATRLIKAYPDHQAYLTKYQKLRAAIKYHPIFTDEGSIEPLNIHDAPPDIHEIIGQRLPDELFFYMSRGVISARLIDLLVSGQLAIKAPLEGGDTEEFRKLLDSLNPIRAHALSLITSPLNRYWQSTRVVDVHYWFNPGQPRSIVVKEVEPRPAELVNKWHVKEDVFREKLGDQTPDLKFALTALLDPEFVAKTVSKRNNENLLKTKNEIILNTYWRFLQLREYIDKDTHELTPWGKALQSALAHTIAELEIEEAVVLGFELLRTKSVKFGTLPPGGSSKGPEDVRKHIFLISRIASLASLSHKSTGYTGPLSRPLLAFNSLANVTITALRSLVEAVLGSLLLGGDSEKVSRQDWFEISSALPFGHPANCAAGIAAKMYLDNFAGDESADIPDDVKEERKADLINMFRDAEDVEGDVDRSWMLWGAIVSGVRTIQKDNIVAGQDALFKADEWLIDRI